MNYFAQCQNEAEIKARYRALARQHHPDLGGDCRTMQDVNAAYDLAMRYGASYTPPQRGPSQDFNQRWARSQAEAEEYQRRQRAQRQAEEQSRREWERRRESERQRRAEQARPAQARPRGAARRFNTQTFA